VTFRKESEPYMKIAIAGSGKSAGVTVAEVNLKFIWDVVSKIKIGKAGHAFVLDREGVLIAHPDISLVLQKTTFAGLDQVNAGLERKVDERTLELTEALEQQTVTAEILRVISSSPTDVQPVFDVVARSAARFCDAQDVLILRLDGEILRWVAGVGSFGASRT